MQIGKLPLPPMKAFAPSKGLEEELESWLVRLEREAPSDDTNIPSHRLRVLCEDVLRWEWLRRRAERGIARLDRTPIELEKFRARGRILMPSSPGGPYSFAPESGPAQPFELKELLTRDIAVLAAVGEKGAENTLDRAFSTPEQRRLCLAIGIGYWYSPNPDRYAQARKWMGQARTHDQHVPAFRFDDLDEKIGIEREQMAREFLQKAQDHAAAKRYDKAHLALDEVAKEHQGRDYWPTLETLLRSARARFLFDEANLAKGDRNWMKVRQLLQRLRKEDETFQPDAVAALHGLALLNSGNWTAMALQTPLPTGKTWTWPGKTTGTGAPAKYDGANSAMVLGAGGPLFLEAKKTDGATGFRAKVSLNQLQQSFDFGVIFDAQDMMGEMRRCIVKSTGKVEVGTRADDRWAPDKEHDLVGLKLKAHTLYEIALVTDGQVTVVFFGEVGKLQPLFSMNQALNPKLQLGIWADAESSFTEVQVRDPKN